MHKLIYTILFIVVALGSTKLKAQQMTRVLFVFDASNSMNARWQSQSKITTAKALLSEAMEELKYKENLEVAMRVYGHQFKHIAGRQNCDDTELVVPFHSYSQTLIIEELAKIRAQGTTPIARSLMYAADDFPECDNCRNVIVLITDGIEACDEDPCAVSRALQKKGVVVKPFIIGMGLGEESKSTFECVGNYFDASSEEAFEKVLDIVITSALNNTTTQINLLDESGNPSETNIGLSIYDSNTGILAHNIIHTMNDDGNPDTLSFDPVITYKILAHTLPPVTKDKLNLVPGIHNVLSLNTPQGDLNLKHNGIKSEYPDLKCIIRKSKESDIVNVQTFGTIEKYITGKYDLEILTLPRTYIEDVQINQSEISDIQIPNAGVLLLTLKTPGYGSVLSLKKGNFELVTNIDENTGNQRIIIQPGTYTFVYRAKNSKQTFYSIEKEFTIKPGITTRLNL